MFAIFHIGENVVGWKALDYEGEESTFELDYILLPDAPNCPEGHYMMLRGGVVEYIPLPEAPPTREETVDAELASLREQQALIQAALDEILLGGI